MTTILIIAGIPLTLGIGILIGNRLTWWWIERQWQRNPYAFRTLIEEVINLRESRAKKKKEKEGV